MANNILVFHLSDPLIEDKIRDARLAPFVKVWKAGTVTSFFGSLYLFLDILMARKVGEKMILTFVLAILRRLQRTEKERPTGQDCPGDRGFG